MKVKTLERTNSNRGISRQITMGKKLCIERCHGTVAGGIRAIDGIVMGVDSRSAKSGRLFSDTDDKLYVLKNGIGVLSGSGHSRKFIRDVWKAVDEEIEDTVPAVKYTSHVLKKIIVKAMQDRAKDCPVNEGGDHFGITLILGMYDYSEKKDPKPVLNSFTLTKVHTVKVSDNKPFLYSGCYEPDGMSHLERMHRADMSIEHAISVMDVFIGLAAKQAELDKLPGEIAGIGGSERICVIQPRDKHGGIGRCLSFEKFCTVMREDISKDMGYIIKVDMGKIQLVTLPPTTIIRDYDQKHIRQLDLTSKSSQFVYKADGGSISSWPLPDGSMLKESKVGAYQISLQKNGLALPSYSDSPKVAYVCKGSGISGITLAKDGKQKVIPITEGDAIALPSGVVTWWFNKEDVELMILFMGDTSKGRKVGEFTEYSHTGEVPELTAVIEGIPIESLRIVMVKEDKRMFMPTADDAGRHEVAINCLEDSSVKNQFMVLDTDSLPLVERAGLAGAHIRIDAKSMFLLGFPCDSAYQAIYIVRGKGCAQIVGLGVKCNLAIGAGNIFIVPKFFIVTIIAGGEDLHLFSIITTPNPVFSLLAGSTSVWQLSPEAEKSFSFKTGDEMFFPAA